MTRRPRTRLRRLHDDELNQLVALNNAQRALYELRLGGAGLAYVNGSDQKRAEIRHADAHWLQVIDGSMGLYDKADSSVEELAQLKIWKTAYPAFIKNLEQTQSLTDAGRLEEANALRMGETTTQLGRAQAAIQKLAELQDAQGHIKSDALHAESNTSRLLLLGSMLLGVLLAGALALGIARSVARRAAAIERTLTSLAAVCATGLADGLQAMAAQDLTIDVQSSAPA